MVTALTGVLHFVLQDRGKWATILMSHVSARVDANGSRLVFADNICLRYHKFSKGTTTYVLSALRGVMYTGLSTQDLATIE